MKQFVDALCLGAFLLFLLWSWAANARSCSVEEKRTEWKEIQTTLHQANQALTLHFRRQGYRLGLGWWGNVSRKGPQCDEVADVLQGLLDRAFRDVTLSCFSIALLFDEGRLPYDLVAHVYFGVTDKNKEGLNSLVGVFDPWRYGNSLLRSLQTSPNSPEQVILLIQ